MGQYSVFKGKNLSRGIGQKQVKEALLTPEDGPYWICEQELFIIITVF